MGSFRSGFRIAAAVLVAAVIVAQAIRIDTVNPPVEGDVGAPPAVDAVLRRACYDCHSNQTVWPWYSQVAPISWLLANDAKEGRRELNFSKWNTYDAKKRAKRFKETAKETAKGKMPPWYYVLVHPDATLSTADHETLQAWTAEELAQLRP